MTNKKDKHIIYVRSVLWFGIIADFVNAVQYIFPESFLNLFGIYDSITPLLRFIFIHAASLMAAWTMLLAWADRKPIERRGVLLLTVPIAIGICFSFFYLITLGTISKIWILFLTGPIITAGLFLTAYLTACRINKNSIELK